MTNNQDPYQLRPEDVAEPPSTLLDSFRRIGPGIILAASIVGSGELIATTTLGAKVGYAALWIILLSCFIKPAVQAEMGRYIIATGETGLESFNHVPGPRLKVNWIVWMWIVMTLMTMFQVGAMFAGVSQVMFLLTGIAVKIWILIFLAITLALLLGGGYDRIEGIAMVKVGLFTMLTFLAALLLAVATGQPSAAPLRDAALALDVAAGALAVGAGVLGAEEVAGDAVQLEHARAVALGASFERDDHGYLLLVTMLSATLSSATRAGPSGTA